MNPNLQPGQFPTFGVSDEGLAASGEEHRAESDAWFAHGDEVVANPREVNEGGSLRDQIEGLDARLENRANVDQALGAYEFSIHHRDEAARIDRVRDALHSAQTAAIDEMGNPHHSDSMIAATHLLPFTERKVARRMPIDVMRRGMN